MSSWDFLHDKFSFSPSLQLQIFRLIIYFKVNSTKKLIIKWILQKILLRKLLHAQISSWKWMKNNSMLSARERERDEKKFECWVRWWQRHEMSTWKMCNIKNKFTNVVYIKFFLLCYDDFRGSNLFSILAFSLAQLFPLAFDTLILNEKSDFPSYQERDFLIFRGD